MNKMKGYFCFNFSWTQIVEKCVSQMIYDNIAWMVSVSAHPVIRDMSARVQVVFRWNEIQVLLLLPL